MNYVKPRNYYLGNLQSRPDDLNRNGIDDIKETNIPSGHTMPEFEPVPKKSFKESARHILNLALDTVRAKNKVGKILYSLIGIGGAASVVTPESTILNLLKFNIMNFELLDIGIWLLVAAITFLTSRQLVKGIMQDILQEIQQAAQALRKARSADSPAGKDLSKEEKQMLLKEVDDILTLIWRRLLRNKIASLFGVKIQSKNP